jgi:hypothetical protein
MNSYLVCNFDNLSARFNYRNEIFQMGYLEIIKGGISMRSLIVFLAAMLLSLTAIASDNHASNSDQVCANLVANINKSRNVELMYECYDFYWHGGNDPLGGQFTSMVKIGRRVVAVNPQDAQMYTGTAWLEWSGYVTWLKNPSEVPDGAGRADSAVQLLNQGLKYLGEDPLFRKDVADTIWPLAKNYRKDFFPFVITNYEAMLDLTKDVKLKVRAALNIGHIYRRDLQDTALAIVWYKKVLEMEPDNKVAKNYLEQLDTDSK